MARSPKNYVCVKCGKPFTKWVGGIVMTPEEQQLMLRPVCDKCKAKSIGSLLKKFTGREG